MKNKDQNKLTVLLTINPFPNKSWFLCVCSTSLLKTLWKKENEQFLLFSQCFLPVWITFYHFHQIKNCRLQTLLLWKSLKFVVLEEVNHGVDCRAESD